MRKSSVIISVLLCIAIAALAYFWAMGMIDSNYAYRSVLKDNAPEPGAALGVPSSQRVVFVLIDALRIDTSLNTDVMPTLNRLRSKGASAIMHSRPPSFSEPGYSTLLIGAWPEINDGPVFNLDYEEIPTFTQDNLFSAAHRAGLKTAVSGYYWFEKLIPQSDVDFSFYTPGEDAIADGEVLNAALLWLTANQAQLVLIHIDQVDYAGHHEGGPQSPNWDAAAKRSDDMLTDILATLDLSVDTIVVLSDHGQIDAGGHGGQDPIVLLEPFVIAGAGVKPGQYADIQMADVAPTLSALLGLNLPASTQGIVQTQMLNLSDSVVNSLPNSVKAQQSALVTAYIAAVNPNTDVSGIPNSSSVAEYQSFLDDFRSQKVFSGRLLRAIPVALLFAIAITILIRNRKNGSLIWILGGLLFLVLFNFRYAVLDQKVYSLSSIISQMDLILYIGITSGVCFLISWCLVILFRNRIPQTGWSKSKKTLALGLTTVFIISIPALLSFVLNGPVVTWVLPDYLVSFIALLALIQILIVCIFTIIIAGLTELSGRVFRKA